MWRNLRMGKSFAADYAVNMLAIRRTAPCLVPNWG